MRSPQLRIRIIGNFLLLTINLIQKPQRLSVRVSVHRLLCGKF